MVLRAIDLPDANNCRGRGRMLPLTCELVRYTFESLMTVRYAQDDRCHVGGIISATLGAEVTRMVVDPSLGIFTAEHTSLRRSVLHSL